VLARGEVAAAFITRRKVVGGCFLVLQGNQAVVWAAAWLEYGGKGRRRAAAISQWLGQGPIDVTHTDHRLTKVNAVDLLIRVN
jgi:hypothetical protein